MAVSVVKICNQALSLFGNTRISSLSEATEASRVCNLCYEQVRDEVLSDSGVDWNCAIVRAELTALSDDPDFGWDHQYQLPANTLRVIAQVTNEGDVKNIPWVRESDRILTDESDCYILYIQRLTDPTKFSPSFIRAVYTLLGSVLAGRLAQDKKRANELLIEYLEVALPKAKMANAQEGYIENEEGDYSWSGAGRGT